MPSQSFHFDLATKWMNLFASICGIVVLVLNLVISGLLDTDSEGSS
jgi:hypothetical protein